MKDVPSTERMVMCSQRWKLLKQGDKDAYQKRCEQVSRESSCQLIIILKGKITFCLKMLYFIFQRKKDFEIGMNRFLSVSQHFGFDRMCFCCSHQCHPTCALLLCNHFSRFFSLLYGFVEFISGGATPGFV